MKRNIKLFKSISNLKWEKIWVRGGLCFSGMGWIKSNSNSLAAATKQLSKKLQNLL
jgi:hypothetical protein